MSATAESSTPPAGSRSRWSLGPALLALASTRAAAGPSEQLHPPFLVFLLLLAAWCLGESIPSD